LTVSLAETARRGETAAIPAAADIVKYLRVILFLLWMPPFLKGTSVMCSPGINHERLLRQRRPPPAARRLRRRREPRG
jgi:hypothetical protein